MPVQKKLLLGIARKRGDTQKASGADSLSALTPSAKIAELKTKIFTRDENKCVFCGFEAKKYQDIHVLNGDSSDHRLDNLVTACQFCNQCFDLEKVVEMRSGLLIWMPEMSQAQLHHVARAIYVARISQGSVAEAAKAALEAIMARREDAKARVGTDDPFVLATVMRDYLGPKSYGDRGPKLEGLRLFPRDRRNIKEGDLEFNQFPQILAYWRSKDGPFGGRIPGQWPALLNEVRQEAA